MIQDIQSGGDTRAVAINRVGIRKIKIPMLFCEDSIKHPTVGEWSVDTDLSADIRGTHMSRLVRVLQDNARECDYARFVKLPEALAEKLAFTRCMLSVDFTCFIEKTAPVSGEKGFVDFSARFVAHDDGAGRRCLMQVVVPVTSLCPCSKAISQYGAHNQRSHITLAVEPDTDLRVRDIVTMAELGASCELYSVLKRSDERHVTERAYDNPKFVEDIVRDLAVTLGRENSVKSYRVEAENFESIHNHSAYAVIESEAFPGFMLR